MREREEELLFCAWENFPRVALCRAVDDSQLISVEREAHELMVGKRSRFSLVSTLIGAKSRPFISSFGRQVFLLIRFDFAPIRINLVQSTFYTRASQSENVNYFRALFLQPLRDDEKFFAASIILFIHNDEMTHMKQRLPETINSRLVFCILSLFSRSHCSWRSFFHCKSLLRHALNGLINMCMN